MVFIIVDNQTSKKSRYDTETINCKTEQEAAEVLRGKWSRLSDHDKKLRDEFYLTDENGKLIAHCTGGF